jgi:hypothetical protein
MATAKLEDGDIIVVQRALSPDEKSRVRFPSAPQFFEYVLQVRRYSFQVLGLFQAHKLLDCLTGMFQHACQVATRSR